MELAPLVANAMKDAQNGPKAFQPPKTNNDGGKIKKVEESSQERLGFLVSNSILEMKLCG